MKRKDIEIGKEYGVIRRASERAVPTKAKVVALDGEYNARRSGGFSSVSVPRKDGIVVEFEVPHWVSFDTFHPAKPGMEVNTITSAVLPSSRLVVEEWEPIEKRRIEEQRLALAAKVKADAKADRATPIIAEVNTRLKNLGVEHKVTTHSADGRAGKRVVSASYTFTHEQLAKLLYVTR